VRAPESDPIGPFWPYLRISLRGEVKRAPSPMPAPISPISDARSDGPRRSLGLGKSNAVIVNRDPDHLAYFTNLDDRRARPALAPGISHPFKYDRKVPQSSAPAEHRVDAKPGVKMAHRGVQSHFLVEVRERANVGPDLIVFQRDPGPEVGQFLKRLLRLLAQEH
jgi:hypothetical protein